MKTIPYLNELTFESLLNTSNGDYWYPIFVDDINGMFNVDYKQDFDFAYKIGKNLSYNFQYLEFLQKQLYELRLSEILRKMTYKNYVITALSIIETIFAFLVKKNGFWRMNEWKEMPKKKSETHKENGKLIRAVTTQYENVKTFEDMMDFSDLIQIVRDRKLIELENNNWKVLMYLKKLRNRVHIRITKNVSTEYNDFSERDYLLSKAILSIILFKKDILLDKDKAKFIFKFLKLSKEEKKMIIKSQD